jgi:hypothetical protein
MGQRLGDDAAGRSLRRDVLTGPRIEGTAREQRGIGMQHERETAAAARGASQEGAAAPIQHRGPTPPGRVIRPARLRIDPGHCHLQASWMRRTRAGGGSGLGGCVRGLEPGQQCLMGSQAS